MPVLPPGIERRLLDESPELMLVVDEELVCRFASAGMAELTGYTPRDAIGTHMSGVIHRDDWPSLREAVESARSTPGRLVVGEFRARVADGRWLDINAHMRWISHAGASWLAATCRDVTNDRANAAALRRKQALESALDHVQREFIHAAAGGIDAALGRALAETGRFLGADRAYLLTYDFGARTESMTHEFCAPGIEPELPSYQQVSFDHFPSAMQRSLAGEVIAVRRIEELDEEWQEDRDHLLAEGLVSLLELPIQIDGETVGSLGYDWVDRPADWTEDDLDVLSMFAASFAQVLARKASERERDRALFELRRGFDASPSALALVDLEGTLLRVNDELCRLVGFPASELVGEFAGVLVHPDSLQHCIEWGAELMACDATVIPVLEAPLRTTPKHGTRWVEVHASAVREQDELVGFVIQVTEVTARKRAEAARDESEARYTTLVDHLPDPVLRLSLDGTMLVANPAAERILSNLSVGAAGRERLWQMVQTLASDAAMTEEAQVGTFELMTTDGWRYLEIRAIPERNLDGRVDSVLCVSADLTDRRRTEAELAYRASHDPLTDLPNRNLFLSHLHVSLSQLDRSDEGAVGGPVPRPGSVQGGERLAGPRVRRRVAARRRPPHLGLAPA